MILRGKYSIFFSIGSSPRADKGREGKGIRKLRGGGVILVEVRMIRRGRRGRGGREGRGVRGR